MAGSARAVLSFTVSFHRRRKTSRRTRCSSPACQSGSNVWSPIVLRGHDTIRIVVGLIRRREPASNGGPHDGYPQFPRQDAALAIVP